MTEFKQIEGFQYEINPEGVIRRIHKKGTYKILKPIVNKQTRYLMVALCKQQKHYWFCIHRLLALSFIPNPESKPQVDHIDRHRQNNTLTNLRWVNNQENNLNKHLLVDIYTCTYFRVQYYDDSGKGRKSKRFKTEREAEEFRDTISSINTSY